MLFWLGRNVMNGRIFCEEGAVRAGGVDRRARYIDRDIIICGVLEKAIGYVAGRLLDGLTGLIVV